MFAFELTSENEVRFFQQLQRFISSENTFEIRINNFDFFRSGQLKTVYANIEESSSQLFVLHEKIRKLMLDFKGFKNRNATKLSKATSQLRKLRIHFSMKILGSTLRIFNLNTECRLTEFWF